MRARSVMSDPCGRSLNLTARAAFALILYVRWNSKFCERRLKF